MTPPLNLKGRDKVVMAIIGTLVGVPLIYAATIVVPILLKLAIDTTYLLGILIGLFVTATVLWDSRTAIYYWWANTSRNIRKAVARDNPIGTMDTAISRFEGRLDQIDDHLNKSVAATKRLEKDISDMKKESAKADSLALAAKSQNKSEAEVARHARSAKRWEDDSEELIPLYDTLARMGTALGSAREVCVNSLEDMKDQRRSFEKKFTAMKTGQTVAQSMSGFFKTNPDLEMLQHSIDEIERQTTEAEAEIDNFINAITPAIQTNDLKKAAEAEAALARFNAKFISGGQSAAQKTLPEAIVEADIVTPERAKAPISTRRAS